MLPLLALQLGFLAALIGCFVTATKTVAAESLLQGRIHLDSMNTVHYMAPIAALFLLPRVIFV